MGGVQDDKTLLKKSIKRQEAGKRKSAAQWKERKKETDKSMKDALSKRNDNVQAHITDVKTKFQAAMDKKARVGWATCRCRCCCQRVRRTPHTPPPPMPPLAVAD